MTSTAKPAITNYKQFYTSPWGIAFIAYFVVMGLVGAFTPADILKANPWAREFCDFMASLVPQIDAVTKLNIAPDINRFYFSVMWAGSPVAFILIGGLLWTDRQSHLSNPKLIWRSPFWKQALWLLLIGTFMLLMSYVTTMEAKDHGRLIRAAFGYPIGRIFLLQSLVLFPLIVASFYMFFALGWLTGYIPRNIKYQNELEQNNG
jgi:hypothetical protein